MFILLVGGTIVVGAPVPTTALGSVLDVLISVIHPPLLSVKHSLCPHCCSLYAARIDVKLKAIVSVLSLASRWLLGMRR